LYGEGDTVLCYGYQPLAEKLAQGLKIRLNCPVSRIAYDPDGNAGVRLTTSQGELTADAALVTLPLGVLKAGAVEFDPPLPARKSAAIEHLGVGCLAKVVFTFERAFWPPNQYVFGCLPDDKTADYPLVAINLWASHELPSLVFLLGGERGKELEGWSEARAWEWGLETLRNFFGADVPRPTAMHRTSWCSDPYSLGAYSYVKVGATPADMRALSEPIGQALYFAGEATHPRQWATVHGAYLSGLREAARISGDASILPEKMLTESRRWRRRLQRAERFFNLRSKVDDPVETARRLEHLQNSEVFGALPEEDLRLLVPLIEERAFADGAIVFHHNEEASEAFLVVEGEMLVFNPSGELNTRLAPGGIFGMYALFTDQRRLFSATAAGNLHCFVISFPILKRFLLTYPEAMMILMKNTVERLVAAIHDNPAPAQEATES